MSTTGHGHGELDSGLPSTGQGNPAHEAAFFDLDRTLVGGSTLFYVALAAYKVGFLTRRQMISGAIANIRFRLSGLTDEGAQQLRERVRRELSGVEENAMRRLMPAVLAGILPRIYPQMLDIAYRHKDAGRQVYIFTASSQGIAELLAAILDFDDGIGTRPEIINGHYTGHIKGAYIYREGKAQAVRELAAHKGINLADSWAYSDSESDLSFLRTVGNAVAVNPDAELERVAKEEGWEIIRLERLRLRLLSATFATLAVVGGLGAVMVGRLVVSRSRSCTEC